jgi:hypothetical protein
LADNDFTRLLRDYKDTLNNKKQFVGLIKDFMPGQPLQVNLLLALYEMGVHAEIEKTAQINNAFAYRFVKRLCDEHGVSRFHADWAVSLWCVCYGKNILNKPCEIKISSGKPGGEPSIREEKVSKALYQDLFTYKKSADGKSYSITGFIGENCRTLIIPNRYENNPVRVIGKDAFKGCGVQEAIITDGIAVIDEGAFSECVGLKQVIFPDSLLEIGNNAFYGCSVLGTALVPAKIEKIGNRAFSGVGVKSPAFPKTLYQLGDSAYEGCQNITDISIPESIVLLANGAFSNCVSLKKATLHGKLEGIGDSVFQNCSNLKEINVPESVRYIGNDAFKGTDKGFLIICIRGTYAESYARKNNIMFQLT